MKLLYTTVGSERAAAKLIGTLLKERYAACGLHWQVHSAYWYKGKLFKEKESVILCKTSRKNAAAAAKRMRELHPYETPVILQLNAKAFPEVEKWLVLETRK